MPVHDDLGKRMKENYEMRARTYLMRRTPVAIRIDGKAFHTFTSKFKRPFDEILIRAMQKTTESLCANIQGCVFGYTQSDEITLILCDYQTLTTDAWFDYQVQKICSVTASMATMYFNKHFDNLAADYVENTYESWHYSEEEEYYTDALLNAMDKGAMFDARCFNIPKEEVTNLIYWRQLDATRNSIQMVGQAYFSHSKLHSKTCNNIQDMLMEEFHINWNDYPIYQKRGTAVYKKDGYWYIDKEMPILRGEDRNYVDRLINFEE